LQFWSSFFYHFTKLVPHFKIWQFLSLYYIFCLKYCDVIFLNEVFKKICYNFIVVELFPSSVHIPRILKFITSHFYSLKIWWRDQNCQILKSGDQFCKMMKIEEPKLQLSQKINYFILFHENNSKEVGLNSWLPISMYLMYVNFVDNLKHLKTKSDLRKKKKRRSYH